MRRDELAGQEARQILGQRAGVRIADRDVERERLVDDRRELARYTRHQLADRLRGPLRGRVEHLLAGRRGVGRLACEQVVERRAERVDIGGLVDIGTRDLLGRHEARRAEHGAVVRPQRASGIDGGARLVVGLADDLREAPVDQHGLAKAADEDVRRLEIAMDHAAAVRVGHRLGHREDVGQEREPRPELLAFGDQLIERLAADLAHHVVGRAVRRGAGVVDRHDRRMLEPRRDPGLAREAAQRVGIADQHLLDRDGAAQQRVGRFDDAAHAAPRDLLTADVPAHMRLGAPRAGALRECGLGARRVVHPAHARIVAQ